MIQSGVLTVLPRLRGIRTGRVRVVVSGMRSVLRRCVSGGGGCSCLALFVSLPKPRPMPVCLATGTPTATALLDFLSYRMVLVIPRFLHTASGDPFGVLFAVLLCITLKAVTGTGTGAAPPRGQLPELGLPVIAPRRIPLCFFLWSAHSDKHGQQQQQKEDKRV